MSLINKEEDSELNVFSPKSEQMLTVEERREEKRFDRRVKFEQKVFDHLVKEEANLDKILEKDSKLPRPCKCKSLCDYRPYIKRMISSFDKLYAAYEDIYSDYYVLYMKNEVIPQDGQFDIKFSKSLNKKLEKTNESNTNFKFSCSDKHKIEIDEKIDLKQFENYALIYENDFAEKINEFVNINDTIDKHYRKVLAEIEISKQQQPFVVRVFRWLNSFIFGIKTCTCINCIDRENLDIYKKAIQLLYNEYKQVYLDVLALYYAESIDSVEPNHKVVTPSSTYYDNLTKIDQFFKITFENFIDDPNL